MFSAPGKTHVMQEEVGMAFKPPEIIEQNIDQFTGCTWLLAPILEWFDKTDERLFILTGGPGTGKRTIMAWLPGDGSTPGWIPQGSRF